MFDNNPDDVWNWRSTRAFNDKLLTAGVAECKVLSQYVVVGCYRTGLVTHLSTAAISNYVVGAAMLSAH